MRDSRLNQQEERWAIVDARTRANEDQLRGISSALETFRNTLDDMKKSIDNTKKEMLAAAKNMDFLLAAKLRDEMFALEKMMEERF